MVSLLGARSLSNIVIVPNHVWDEMTNDQILEYANNDPVVSGAFVFTEMEANSYIIYDARRDYWGESKIAEFRKIYYLLTRSMSLTTLVSFSNCSVCAMIVSVSFGER